MLYILSFFAAVIPMIAYALIIWWLDRYEREPLGLVLLNFFWGAFGAVILGIIGSIFISGIAAIYIPDEQVRELTGTILIAPFVEESTKGIFLFLMVSKRKFDNVTDGAVYGGAIGLGFGMTENFLYFISFGHTVGNWLMLVIIRTLFSAVMHCISTATFGVFIAYSKFKSVGYKIGLPIVGFLLAVMVHSIWNASVSFSGTTLIGFVFIIISIALTFILFQFSLRTESKIIASELAEESMLGNMQENYIEILPYTSKRNRKGWIDERIRKEYIKTATLLAFRKMQSRQLKTEWQKELYEKEIDYLRTKIKLLLGFVPLKT